MDGLLTLQNAHLRMCVDPQGGSLLSLVSLQHQQAVLREGRASNRVIAACFRCCLSQIG